MALPERGRRDAGTVALTTMIVAPTAGALSDRYPAGLLGGIGMAIATAALLLLAWLPAHPDYIDVAWRMALCGSGFGLYLHPRPTDRRLRPALTRAAAGASSHDPADRPDGRRKRGRGPARARPRHDGDAAPACSGADRDRRASQPCPPAPLDPQPRRRGNRPPRSPGPRVTFTPREPQTVAHGAAFRFAIKIRPR